jgi:protein-S-isoprenylcysteine O-methyltransferase Ste14
MRGCLSSSYAAVKITQWGNPVSAAWPQFVSTTSHFSGSVFPKPYADFVQKLRVASGFALLFAFAYLSHPTGGSLLVGLPFAFVGLFLRSWAAGHLAKNENLATGGPFAYLRNPLYAGTCLVAFGIVLASRSLLMAALFVLVLVFVYLPVVELEEQHLRRIFPAYAAYAARIHRFVPSRKWMAPNQPFSWRLWKRNQEYKALGGFALAVAWLLWKLKSQAV